MSALRVRNFSLKTCRAGDVMAETPECDTYLLHNDVTRCQAALPVITAGL